MTKARGNAPSTLSRKARVASKKAYASRSVADHLAAADAHDKAADAHANRHLDTGKGSPYAGDFHMATAEAHRHIAERTKATGETYDAATKSWTKHQAEEK